MKRLSGLLVARFAIRRLIAVAGAGALLSAGLGVAGASAADQAGTSTVDTLAAGTPATSVSMQPCAVKYAAGSLYIGAYDAVYKVSQRTGAATSVGAGFGFGQACGVAVDGAGNVLVADDDEVVAVAAKTGTFYGKKMIAGRAYPLATGFELVTGAVDVQLDPSGNLVVAVGGDEASHTDAETDSQIFVLAERTGTFYGKKMTKGRLYLIAGELNGGPLGDPCDGPDAAARQAAAPSTATKATQANLGDVIGTLRFDAEGNIILADGGSNGDGPCGGGFVIPPRLAVIPARTGSYYGQKMTVGYIYAIAGLGTKAGSGVPAVDSDLSAVSAVAIDHAGNILVAAANNDDYPRGGIRVIAAKTGTFYGQKMIKGDIYALPGLAYASAVAVDNAGNVLAGNRTENLVQMLAVKTGDFYGIKAHAGRTYTIAGNAKSPL